MSKNNELLEPDDMHGPIDRDELITLYHVEDWTQSRARRVVEGVEP